MDSSLRRALRLSWLALLFVCAVPAQGAVEISFHSKDFGITFPHAFVVLAGTLDETGEPVDTNYGFTVRHLIGPSALLGAVQGEIETVDDSGYVEGSNRHFAMRLDDDQYRAVLSLVERWRALPQPSWSLGRRNCVSFVAAVATLLGLEADTRGYMRRPRAFLERVLARNRQAIAAAGAAAADRATHRAEAVVNSPRSDPERQE